LKFSPGTSSNCSRQCQHNAEREQFANGALHGTSALATRSARMPVTVTLWLIFVWFCVGFFAGLGWHLAAWVIGRIQIGPGRFWRRWRNQHRLHLHNTSKVGDVDQLKAFDIAEAFDRWKDENDPEGVAFNTP
jgi:hypothetical protein